MTKYVKATLIFEMNERLYATPEALRDEVKLSLEWMTPTPELGTALVEILDTEDGKNGKA